MKHVSLRYSVKHDVKMDVATVLKRNSEYSYHKHNYFYKYSSIEYQINYIMDSLKKKKM